MAGHVAAVPCGGQSRIVTVKLSLRELLDSVATHHPLVEAARARARAARGSLTTASLLGNPVLTYQVENAPLPGGQTPSMDREAMTMATLPLEPLYQRGPRVQRAQAELRAAEADASAERQRVALDASRAFYRAALAQIGLEAARDVAAWLDTVVSYNRTRVKEGVAAEADLIRSELERDRAAADVAMREAEAARSRGALAAFLGDTISDFTVAIDDEPLAIPNESHPRAVLPAAPSRLAGGPSFGARVKQDSAKSAMVDRALQARPEMRAARQRLASASASIASERSMLVRQLGVTVGTKQSTGTTSMIAGVSLHVPLFDQNRGEVTRARAEREAATFELVAQERTVRAEVVGAYEAAQLLTERAVALSTRSSRFLGRADEARRIALGAYREGAVPLIQVLDAARAWGDARLAYFGTLYAQHESVLELVVARGDDIRASLPGVHGPSGADGAANLPR